MLARCRDAFATWRYIHEAAEDMQIYRFEYLDLNMAVDVLRACAVQAFRPSHARAAHTSYGDVLQTISAF